MFVGEGIGNCSAAPAMPIVTISASVLMPDARMSFLALEISWDRNLFASDRFCSLTLLGESPSPIVQVFGDLLFRFPIGFPQFADQPFDSLPDFGSGGWFFGVPHCSLRIALSSSRMPSMTSICRSIILLCRSWCWSVRS